MQSFLHTLYCAHTPVRTRGQRQLWSSRLAHTSGATYKICYVSVSTVTVTARLGARRAKVAAVFQIDIFKNDTRKQHTQPTGSVQRCFPLCSGVGARHGRAATPSLRGRHRRLAASHAHIQAAELHLLVAIQCRQMLRRHPRGRKLHLRNAHEQPGRESAGDASAGRHTHWCCLRVQPSL